MVAEKQLEEGRPWAFQANQENECRVTFRHNIIREFLVAQKFYSLLEEACFDSNKEQSFLDLLTRVRLSVESLRFFMTSIEKNGFETKCMEKIKNWLCTTAKKNHACAARLLELVLQPNHSLQGEESAPLDLTGIEADNLYIWNCTLRHVNLHGAKLRNMQMINMTLEDVDLRAADLSGLRLAPAKPINGFHHWKHDAKWQLAALYQNGQVLQYSFTDRFMEGSYTVRPLIQSDATTGLFVLNGKRFLHSDKSLYLLDDKGERTEALYQISRKKALQRVILGDKADCVVVVDHGEYQVFRFHENTPALYSLPKLSFGLFDSVSSGQLVRVSDTSLVLIQPNGKAQLLCEWKRDYECFTLLQQDSGKASICIISFDKLHMFDFDGQYHESPAKSYSIEGKNSSICELRFIKEGVFVAASKSDLYILTIIGKSVTIDKLNTAVKLSNVKLGSKSDGDRLEDENAYSLLAGITEESENV